MPATVTHISNLPTVGVAQTYRNERGSGRISEEDYPVVDAFDSWVARGMAMQSGALMDAVSSYRGNGHQLKAAKAAVNAVRRRFALAIRGYDVTPGMTPAERMAMSLGFAEWNLARIEAHDEF